LAFFAPIDLKRTASASPISIDIFREAAMTKRFWRGFALGAAAGAGATIGAVAVARVLSGKRRVVRLEKALQIGRPVNEVFPYWSELERLPEVSDCIREIRRQGDLSHWKVDVGGRVMEWDAEVEQFIPNQAIGWKSIRGPKHTGRMTFAPIGDDTLVQVTMNYVPPAPVLRPFVANLDEHLEFYLEQVLRDFKAHLEGKGQEGRTPAVRSASERVGPGTQMTQSDASRATGTYGGVPAVSGETPVDRFGNRANPVEYTSPPEAKR
jgi:uncharacterized membrane protein